MATDPIIGPVRHKKIDPGSAPINQQSSKDPNRPGATRGGVPVTNARTRTPRKPTAAKSGKPTTGNPATGKRV